MRDEPVIKSRDYIMNNHGFLVSNKMDKKMSMALSDKFRNYTPGKKYRFLFS